jgi:large conductance mechanosensitive channel
MFQEFKKFIMRGNVLDLAVGVIIGAAFGAIVKSFVDDILMPPIGLLLGNVDFANIFAVLKAGDPAGPYAALAAAKEAGAVTMNFGVFINTLISFLITAFAIFLVIKGANALQREKAEAPAPPPAPTTKPCPYCFTDIPIPATRCPHCTSELG